MSQSTVVLFFVTIGILVIWKIMDSVNKKKKQAEQSIMNRKSFSKISDDDEEKASEPVAGSAQVPAEINPAALHKTSAQPMSDGKHKFGFNPITIRVMITMILLLAAVYIILSKNYEPDSQKWAFGVVGTILGYWLKTEKS